MGRLAPRRMAAAYACAATRIAAGERSAHAAATAGGAVAGVPGDVARYAARPSARVLRMSSRKGKTLFITGASRGIGLAIAVRAARDGANVVIAAKSDVPNPKLPGTIHSAAAAVEKAGGQALAIKCDIREETQVRAAVEQTVTH